jgi:O-antigen/teichoic acid export membrane protein
VLSKAVAVLMLPIYTRWLTPADYGVMQLIQMTFEVVTIFAGSRIALGVFHFYHKEEREEARREVLSTAFLMLATTYWLAAAGTSLAAPAIARLVFGEGGEYTTLIRLAATSMAFEGLITVPTLLLRLQDRSKLFVMVSLARLTLQVVLNLIFLIPLKMGLVGVLWSSVVTHALVGTVLGVHLLASVGTRIKASAARAFFHFGIPLVAMQVATFIGTFGDRYFLNRSGSTTDVGLYGLAYQFGFLVANIGFGPFNQVWGPQRFAVAKRSDRDRIISQVFVWLNVALLTFALCVSLFAGDVLRLIAAPAFHTAAAFVPVLCMAYVAQSWAMFLNLGIYVTERTGYFALANWVAAIVAVVGYVVLIPLWLAWGAAVATLMSLSVLCWLSHVFSQRLWRVKYRWGPVIRMAALAVAIGTVSALSPPISLPLSLAFHASLVALYAALLWVLPILTPEEREQVRHHARRLRQRIAAA